MTAFFEISNVTTDIGVHVEFTCNDDSVYTESITVPVNTSWNDTSNVFHPVTYSFTEHDYEYSALNDINGDGTINLLDIVWLHRFLSFDRMQQTHILNTMSYNQRRSIDFNYDRIYGNYVDLILIIRAYICLLYTSPSPRDGLLSRMPSSA